jgi:diguanylate cyclase (GGDEF)-like protein
VARHAAVDCLLPYDRHRNSARSALRFSVMDAQRALEVLLGLTRELTAERSLNRALKLVTDAALNLLPGDHASIRVLDHTRTELLSGARSGSGAGKQPVRHTPGHGVAGWVVDEGEVARISDAREDSRFVPKPNQGFEIRSILAVPLWSAGEVVGVLAVTSARPETYDESHESLVCLLANCAVPPIEKARLARLAVTDPQTMAFNQGYLIPGLEREMEKMRGTPGALSVLMMDLDHFKGVNDRFGHAAGDRALREFADRVRQTTRDNDVVVRRGGDEFVLIMPGTDKHSAKAVAERIRTTMAAKPIHVSNQGSLSMTVSIGVATWNGQETPEQLENRADAAMYEAKVHGRDSVWVAAAPGTASDPGVEAAPVTRPPAEVTPKAQANADNDAENDEASPSGLDE